MVDREPVGERLGGGRPAPAPRRRGRALKFTFGGLLALAASVVMIGRAVVGTAIPERNAMAAVRSSEPVRIEWLAHGVPSIHAGSEEDLYRGLGFVHARDRLWQMDLLRRVGSGRLSEILGAAQVGSDKFLRTLGLRLAAQADLALLEESERLRLEAYAGGVNDWLEQRPGALPPEFLALGYEPGPWEVLDSLTLGKLIAWDLSTWSMELDHQSARDVVGQELEQSLEPRYPSWGPLTLAATAKPAAEGGAAGPSQKARAAGEEARGLRVEIPELARRVLGRASIASASNAWVVSGRRTTSGRPILANDTHQALQAPSIWYLAALHGGATDACGLTVPGLPFVIVGRTSAVAWGITASRVDDVDFFVEKLSPDGSGYLTESGTQPLMVRTEVIAVRDGDAVEHTVRSTRHGPLLSDVEPRSRGRALALRWAALDAGRSAFAFAGLNRARSVESFELALSELATPTINVLYAGADGSINYHLAGRVPVRRGGGAHVPVPGWTGESEWLGYRRFEELPSSRDPEDGFIASANNRIDGDENRTFSSAAWSEPYRIMRLRELLLPAADLDAAKMARMQLDVVDTHAVRALPHAVRAAALVGNTAAAETLRGWNGEARGDSPAAALFYVWFERLRHRLADDEFRGLPIYFPTLTVDAVLDLEEVRWSNDIRTTHEETLDEISSDAMRDAIALVEMRPWSEVLATSSTHALGSSRILEWLLDLDVGPFSGAGSNHTLNVAGYGDIEAASIVSTFGPAMRFVADMADPTAAGLFALPTGQSGVPLAAEYRDQRQLWAAGQLITIPLSRLEPDGSVQPRAAQGTAPRE